MSAARATNCHGASLPRDIQAGKQVAVAAFVRLIIEYLVSVFILASMGAAVVTQLDCGFDLSREDNARIQIAELRKAVVRYRAKNFFREPRHLDELVATGVMMWVPADPWGKSYLWIPWRGDQPSCLLSAGADRDFGTQDDIGEYCNPEALNARLLVDACLAMDRDATDAHGRPIRLVPSFPSKLLSWSFGADGLPDTADDAVAKCIPGHAT